MEKSEQSFSKLIADNKDKIYRICCYYLLDEEDRKDLFQEALLNIWKGYGSFRGQASFTTWAIRITINTALHFLSKKRSIQQKVNQYTSYLISEDKNRTYDGQYEIDLLQKGISQLPLIDMLIISLLLEEFNSKEIANIIGITDSNVRVRIHRAKDTLKKIIEGGLL